MTTQIMLESIDLGPTKRELDCSTRAISKFWSFSENLSKNEQELVVVVPHEIHQGTI
jgi:hypothetical protein